MPPIYLYISDDKGNLIYQYQDNKGLHQASNQKIIPAIAAFDFLGKDFKYNTKTAYDEIIKNDTLNGNVFLTSTGDPTFGSWRYEGYTPENFKLQLIS